jgi:hypothetical protein
MKVLFVGPSLSGFSPDLSGLAVRPPAMQGDIARAVLAGADAIGLVDGFFDAVAAPWHKEILFALDSGVAMLGSSSMGALRAAECAAYGMVPIGVIANAYASGALDDDAAVALTHGPAELGYPPLTEPMVDVAPTLDRLRQLGLLDDTEHQYFGDRAAAIFFKDRSDTAIFNAPEHAALLAAYRTHRVNQKAEDALALVEVLKAHDNVRGPSTGLSPTSSLFARQVLPELQQSRETPASL